MLTNDVQLQCVWPFDIIAANRTVFYSALQLMIRYSCS